MIFLHFLPRPRYFHFRFHVFVVLPQLWVEWPASFALLQQLSKHSLSCTSRNIHITLYKPGMYFKLIALYRLRHKKVSLFGVNFLEFYWLLKNQSICIGKRKDKLKFWGVIYQIWLVGSKVMKKLLFKSAQKRQISTYQIKWKQGLH